MKTLPAVAIVTASFALVLAGLVASGLDEPCPTEDSRNCTWDGGQNGQGRSFVDILGTPFYLED